MGRRRIALLGTCLIVTGLAALVRSQGQDFSKVQVRTEKLADGLFMLQVAGGNIGVSAGPDGVVLVDDDYPQVTDKVLAAVKAISPEPIRFVVNTHWHGDHSGGNENLAKAGAAIVAHDNVRKRMSVEQSLPAFNLKVPPSPKGALPIVTFSTDMTLHLNGDDVQAIYVAPAHTDGDAIVQFRKANVLHMGDLFFNGMYPFIDLGTGGSVDGMIAAADRALQMCGPGTRIIPGHGPMGDAASLRASRDLLVTARDRIKPMVSAGKTLADLKAAAPMKDLDAKWGQSFMKGEAFAEIVFRSYGGK